MGPLDRILFWFFGAVCLIGVTVLVVSLRKALKAVDRNDEGLGMFFWSVGALVGLILVAASLLYFLLPLILYYTGS
jgi:hypothetical protein